MKQFLLTLLCSFFLGNGWSCDVCGAVNSSLGLGTLGQGNRSSIGLNYQYRYYRSVHQPLFNEGIQYSNETFQRADVIGQLRLAQKWQLKMVLPLATNEQDKEGVRNTIYGLGDASISCNYFLINRSDSSGTKRFRWTIGAGGKLPTGKFTEPHNSILLLYPGTGSFDGILQNALFLQRNNWCFFSEVSAVIRTSNRYKYRPGSLFNATLFAQRKFSNWSVFCGLQYAWNGIDYIDQIAVSSSPAQGNILSMAPGATLQWNDWILQGNVHIPLAQALGNDETTQKRAFNLSVTYLF